MPDQRHSPPHSVPRGDASGEGGSSRVVAFPHSHAPERPLTNLPLQLSSFVGREREISEVKRLLTENRLLTLTGPVGCGKTRLALRVASDLVEDVEDGVWVVELASLADPDLVPQTMASTLGISEQPGRSLSETLSEYLEPKKLLFAQERYGEAAQAYRKAIEHDPYLEVAHRGLMRCFARIGERGRAPRHYRSQIELLREELGSSPAPDTTNLYERLRQNEEV